MLTYGSIRWMRLKMPAIMTLYLCRILTGGWGWFLDRGINIIQTDFPQKAPQYAEQRFAKRT